MPNSSKARKKSAKNRSETTIHSQRNGREKKHKNPLIAACLSDMTEYLEKPIDEFKSDVLPASDMQFCNAFAEPLTVISELDLIAGLCCCCLETSGPKSLWDKDESSGCAEVYGEMLGECFNLHFPKQEKADQICETCISRLRDATGFRRQVLACQDRLQALGTATIKSEKGETSHNDHNNTHIKVEITEVDPEGNEIKNDIDPIDGKPSKKQVKKKQKKTPHPSTVNWFRLTAADYRRQGDMFVCSRCDHAYSTRRYLQQHIKMLHLNIGYSCPHCEHSFGRSDQLMKHKLSAHGIDERSECAVCGDRFLGHKYLAKHMKRHEEIKTEDATGGDIEKEFLRKHPIKKGKDYTRDGRHRVCLHCGLKTSQSMKRHILIMHFKMPTFRCPQCQEGFNNITKFVDHKLETHGIDDRIPCNACDKKFSCESYLRTHVQSYHKLGTLRKCKLCSFEAFSSIRISTHMAKHKTSKDNKCKYCSKAFVRRGTMLLHERIHTGDKRKVCKECGQAFVQKASLNYHMSKYHPEVPF